MKRILASGLGMGLGLLTTAAHGQEASWRAVGTRTAAPSAVSTPTYQASFPAPAAPMYAAVAPSIAVSPVPAVQQAAPSWSDSQPPVERPLAAPPIAQASGQAGNRWTPARAVSPPDTGLFQLRKHSEPFQAPADTGTIQVVPSLANQGAFPVAVIPEEQVMMGEVYERAPRLLVTAEFLMWWVRGTTVPPLVSTSPPGQFGFLPGARVLLSGDDLDAQFRQGARFGTVFWFDPCASSGFDGRLFFTGRKEDRFAVNSNQFANLFRPFLAANPGIGEFSEQVTAMGRSTGGVEADTRSNFWGAEANYRDNLCCGCSYRVDLIAGFRYLNLDESLTINEVLTRLVPARVQDFPGAPVVVEPAGTNILIRDRFATTNDFYGGQLGLVGEYRSNRWVYDLRTSVALGFTHQQSTIEGGQIRQVPGQAPQQFVGGLLALNSNIGRRSRDVFSVVPEIGLNVGYQVTDHWKAFVGYNFLYWSNVIRPGDQIDRVIDVTRIPRFVPPGVNVNPANEIRPAAVFRDTDFWAQGVNIGVEYRW